MIEAKSLQKTLLAKCKFLEMLEAKSLQNSNLKYRVSIGRLSTGATSLRQTVDGETILLTKNEKTLKRR